MKRKNGFSFIEVMIAILVLAIGCEMLINLFPACFIYLGKSRIITNATFLCQGKLEELLTEDYDSPAPFDGTFPGYSDYTYHVEKTSFNKKLKEVKVSVYHCTGESRVCAAEFSTLQGGSGVGDIIEVIIRGSFYKDTLVVKAEISQNRVYAFSSDPKNGKIQFVKVGGNAYNFDFTGAGEWRKLKNYWSPTEDAVLPDGGIPGKISVIQSKSEQTGPTGGVLISYFTPQIYVYDLKNKCIWGGFIVMKDEDAGINLYVIGSPGGGPDSSKTWVKVSELP
ncbi:MAG: prepilin-type N-terminal cleavage/methylation domain-containing protein [Firmicutes bacterium]|nr:prepilin-type N-terminal cleavage/methylation domain-containing protein [Bacillota bacterium]